MEAPAVIITDVEEFGSQESTALFYVAVTRALNKLIILVHEPAKESMTERILGAGSSGHGT
jgi:ATP-dependent exoDNAse (exonuclease V) beta subunit